MPSLHPEIGSTSVGAKDRSGPDPNKGHHTFDSAERIDAFYKSNSYGWEDKYLDYRQKWHSNPRDKIVPEYPLCIDLELSSACNLNCPMCYTTTDHFKENVVRKNMPFDLFKSIVDQVAGHIPALRLSWRGEPMLNPHFIDCIRYAKESGISEVSTLTNASHLTLDVFRQCAEAGIDIITVSIDGLLSSYDEIRKPLRFEDTYRKLIEIKYFKNQHSLVKPLIKVQGVWNAIEPDPELYYGIFKPVTDLIAFNPLIDYLGNDNKTKIIYEEGFYCPKQYQRLFIGSDGKASVCNADEYGTIDIGNAAEDTIYDIWHGPRMTDFRANQLKANGFMKYEACQSCFYPRKVDRQLKGSVEGRPIYVENYIGRNQEIGT
jgi:radical SAM protein with 4Fe4S-binding SPASM domain